MILVIGLGNPGPKFKHTRHNLGFMALDKLAAALGLTWQNNARLFCHFIKTPNFILAKPQTFMNNSGQAVKALADYYQIAPENILIIRDDLDLPLGEIKSAQNSGSSGHKGVASIISHLNSQAFSQIKIGLSRPDAKQDIEKFVLEKFADAEKPVIKQALNQAVEILQNSL